MNNLSLQWVCNHCNLSYMNLAGNYIQTVNDNNLSSFFISIFYLKNKGNKGNKGNKSVSG